MTFFDECLEVLGKQASIIENKENKSQKIIKELEKKFPISVSGRIAWDKINKKEEIISIKSFVSKLKQIGKFSSNLVYIIWDNAEIPVVKSSLMPILENIDDITAVSFYVWIFDPSAGWVAELHNDGTITLGLSE